MAKDKKEPSRTYTFRGSGCQINYYDCCTGAHEWMCPDFAKLCCNGWIAKWVPQNNVPEDALLFNNGESILLQNKRGESVECHWNSGDEVQVLIREDSLFLNNYKTVKSKLEEEAFDEKVFFKKMLENKDLTPPNEGFDWHPDLLTYLDLGFSGILPVKERGSYSCILLEYIFVLSREKISHGWASDEFVEAFCQKNQWKDVETDILGNERDGAAVILKKIIAHYRLWRKTRDNS